MPAKRKSPAKGTQARTFLLMALRPEGVTKQQFLAIVGVKRNRNSITKLVARLRDNYGYIFETRYHTIAGKSGKYCTYHLTGKYISNAKIRNYLKSLP